MFSFFRILNENDLQGFRHLLEEGGCPVQLLRRQAVQVHQPEEHQVRAVRGNQGSSEAFEAGINTLNKSDSFI